MDFLEIVGFGTVIAIICHLGYVYVPAVKMYFDSLRVRYVQPVKDAVVRFFKPAP